MDTTTARPDRIAALTLADLLDLERAGDRLVADALAAADRGDEAEAEFLAHAAVDVYAGASGAWGLALAAA